MQRIIHRRNHAVWSAAATRRIEATATTQLAPHALMQRAGLAIARLAQALAPHAQTMWVACGKGNNGGDGLEAAAHLKNWGRKVVVTWLGNSEECSADTHQAWAKAQAAGVQWAAAAPHDLAATDLCIDALLGLGLQAHAQPQVTHPTDHTHANTLQAVLAALHDSPCPVLCVDLPSGLDADTGQYAQGFAPTKLPRAARHTLSLLTLKPGLFTASGRDAAGSVWLDDLGTQAMASLANMWPQPTAMLSGPPASTARPHNSHKGSWGDVAVIGGEGLALRGMGMTGAALLAARAALHSGAGRVLVALLDGGHMALDPVQPELMFRHPEALPLADSTTVCGCGGGSAIQKWIPAVLETSPRLVLDADALNALAQQAQGLDMLKARSQRGQATVLTPHPLEAARLLGQTAQQVQANRLLAAQLLAERTGAVVVLKGSGSVVAAPGQVPHINPTGCALLATAGTGDVLAGMLGAKLAAGLDAWSAAKTAVFLHGLAADRWPAGQAFEACFLAQQSAVLSQIGTMP